MKSWDLIVFSVCWMISQVKSTRLSYELIGSETFCFYLEAPEREKKIAFFYSVHRGETFEINYVVTSPNHQDVIRQKGKRQADLVFTANVNGEYSFCLENPDGSSKLIDVDIALQGQNATHSPLKLADPQHLNNMEKACDSIERDASQLSREQRFLRSFEERDEYMLRSIARRVNWFGFLELALIMLTAGVQVFAIRTFFSGRKTRF